MYKQLTSEQRYAISSMLQSNIGKKEIARVIGVHPSTVYRELKRNSSEYTGEYRYTRAQRYALRRKLRYQRPRKLTPELRARIIRYVRMDWSPQQINGRLKLMGRGTVSHETIYELIRRDKCRGGDLYQHCRFKLKHINHWIRRKGGTSPSAKKSIDSRPMEADGRRFGDWEMDLIVGIKRSAALTMVERSSGKTIVRRLPRGKCAEGVTQAVIQALRPYKEHIRTITTDNGTEFTNFKQIEEELDTQVYYARPYCPWQKGQIENTNMLIRQYIPKRININHLSKQYISMVEERINNRPRKKLKYRTPEFVFNNNIN